MNHEHTCQQNPLYDGRRELYHWYQCRTHLQRCIRPGMLYGMSAFVSRNGSRRYTTCIINSLTQVDCFVCRIIMVSQHSRSAGYFYIINAIITKHLFCNLPARHAITQCHTRISIKFALQVRLHPITDKGNANK